MIELKGAIYARRSKDLDTLSQVRRVQYYLSRIETRLSDEYGQPVKIELADQHIFRDEGQSGATFERGEYARLRAAIAGRAIDVLAIHATDRLGRTDDPTDMLLERRHCMQNGVRVWAEIGDYELTAADEMTVIRYFLESVFAGRERRRTRERTRDGQRTAWERDHAHWAFGGQERFGYHLDADKHLVEDQGQARILRQMVDWVLHEGLNGTQIAERLNLHGVPSPQGNHWWPRSVQRILADPVYAGADIPVTVQDRETGRVERYAIPVPALLEPAQFEAVQRILSEYSRPKGRRPAIYPLSGLLRCGLCGRVFTGFGNRSYAWYRCQGRAKYRQFEIEPCAMPILPTRLVELPIWQQVQAVLADPGLLREALQDDPTQTEQVQVELEAVRAQLDRKLQAQARLATGWDGAMHPQAMQAALVTLRREIETLETRLAELEYHALILRRQVRPRDWDNIDLERLPVEGKAALVREMVHSIQVERLAERRVQVQVRYFSLARQSRAVMSGWTAPLIETMPIVLEL